MREDHHIVPRFFGGTETISLSPIAHAIITLYQCEHYNHPFLHGSQLKFIPQELMSLAKKWMSIRGAHAGRIGGTVSASRGYLDYNSENSIKTFETCSQGGQRGGATTRDSGKLRETSRLGGSVQGPRNRGMAWYHRYDENGNIIHKRSQTPLPEPWIKGRGRVKSNNVM